MSVKQYGGIKACGVNHFLTSMWDSILMGLEQQESAITLMSVDFSKAFNRMQHQACLAALQKKGCSNQTIKMVYHFLNNRTMHIKNGLSMSSMRNVCGGSPQGTKLGNLLFCLTVEDIEEEKESLEIMPDVNEEDDQNNQEDNHEAALYFDSPLRAVPDQYRRGLVASTPCLTDSINQNFYACNQGMKNKINIIRDSQQDESF